MHARVFEREKVLAGGHTGAAVADRAIGTNAGKRRIQPVAERLRREEGSLGADVPLEEVIGGGRDVARHAIGRFDLSAISLRCPRIDEAPLGDVDQSGDLVGVDDHVRSR